MMDYEKAKQIQKELAKFLPCNKYVFVAPAEDAKFRSFIKMAWNHSNTQKPLIRLMNEDSGIDKILTEYYSTADFEVYVVSRYFKGETAPQTFRKYIQTEEIDFDVSKFT